MQKNTFKPSLEFFGIEEQSKPAVNHEEQGKNNRLQNLNDYLSEDQKRAYYYILSQELTYLSENDAYTIALRLPPDIDRYTRWDFEECVQWFQFNKAENSNPAHFIKMFNQKSKQKQERRKRNAQNTSSLLDTTNSHTCVFYNFLEEHD